MRKPFTFTELADLLSSCPPRESFGPQSNLPYLAFELTNTDLKFAQLLRDMPCPVIGIGKSPLSTSCDIVLDDDKALAKITANIENSPIAAMVLVQHLRACEKLPLTDALTAESFAYGTIQQGPEFQNWLGQSKKATLPISDRPLVNVAINDGELSLQLDHPESRNAIGVQMRDALCEALDLALMDETLTKISLTAKGTAFSTGGAIEEFGEVSDSATAHWVRSLRLPAWRLARLTKILEVHVNGAAIGAGAEIAAFGRHVTASPKAWFQLPELKYGLIPGAGGTASIARRIGRQRTAYMALSMEKIRAETALDWGLIDAIID